MNRTNCPRSGAGDRGRPRPQYRLALGSIVFDLLPSGGVRLAGPVEGLAEEYSNLRAFLAAMRKGGG